MSLAFLGVDPGVTGAYALVNGLGQLIDVWAFKDLNTTYHMLLKVTKEYNVFQATLENAHASPQMGVKSAFTYGKNAGHWEGLLTALNIGVVTTTPKAWQKEVLNIYLPAGDSKEKSLAYCCKLFPKYEWGKNHNKADATCLALFTQRRMTRGKV